ncbi:hypothetical protein EVAR_30797_1 [Eumeta japonica]|uniref:Uncharacterized protein n=1 Tax=Eumeta variegata TaxID=151549 RepID=A0A4C1V615_EUMVA|nr:hypothetical protein EVAR_30797_1 [Eumeta japonica]
MNFPAAAQHSSVVKVIYKTMFAIRHFTVKDGIRMASRAPPARPRRADTIDLRAVIIRFDKFVYDTEYRTHRYEHTPKARTDSSRSSLGLQ